LFNYGTSTSPGGFTTGDILGVAIKNNKIWFAKNNVWLSGSPSTETSPSITLGASKQLKPAACGYAGGQFDFNFGQRAFAYTAPSGFKALCDTNLPAPLVAKPNTLMDVALYTGDGGTQTVSGLAFGPDFVWTKVRNIGYGHRVWDTVRGATKRLETHDTTAEVTETTALTAFNSDGFTVGSEANVNQSGRPYVAWCWDAGTSTTTINANAYSAGVPSITSQVRANASAGFSVCTYSGNSSAGATFGHGLGVAPQMVFIKIRNGSDNWSCYHASLGNNKLIQLNNTNAAFTSSDFNNTSPTSSVFSLGGGFGNNSSGYNYVAYCWAPLSGYSAALSWTGNGSNDGTMIHCGFSPRFWIWKRTDSSGDWWMIDTARSNTGNPVDEWLAANRSDAEYPNDGDFDFLSNGIKIRTTSTSVNASGGSYIGFAWASNPFQYARAQ
jgi:hypothetical protein